MTAAVAAAVVIACSPSPAAAPADPEPAAAPRDAAALQARCDARDPSACYALALLLQGGDDTPQDLPRALSLFTVACDADLAPACFSLGLLYDEGWPPPAHAPSATAPDDAQADDAAASAKGSTTLSGIGRAYARSDADEARKARGRAQARALFERACRPDTPDICYDIGRHLEQPRHPTFGEEPCRARSPQACKQVRGRFRALNARIRAQEAAVSFYERACDAQQVYACHRLGLLLSEGPRVGVLRDRARAAAYFARACDADDADACDRLGRAYADGVGVPQDLPKAAAAFARTCDISGGDACYRLGLLYDAGAGVPQDPAKAAALYEATCGVRHAGACRALGTLYARGHGVPQDAARAGLLYTTACEGRDATACGLLGMCYLRGDGVPLSSAQALRLFWSACGDGSGEVCYEIGLTTSQAHPDQLALAARAFERACHQGIPDACYRFGQALFHDPTSTPADLRRALDLHQRACDGGVPRACEMLGFWHAYGAIGLTPDVDEAFQYAQRACDGGAPDACLTAAATMISRHGTPTDLTPLASACAQACDLYGFLACGCAAVAYAHGVGVAPDAARAATFHRESCPGYRDASSPCSELALSYLHFGQRRLRDGDPAAALPFLRRAVAITPLPSDRPRLTTEAQYLAFVAADRIAHPLSPSDPKPRWSDSLRALLSGTQPYARLLSRAGQDANKQCGVHYVGALAAARAGDLPSACERFHAALRVCTGTTRDTLTPPHPSCAAPPTAPKDTP